MGQRIFVLIVTAKLPRKSCKPSLESTLLVCNPCHDPDSHSRSLGAGASNRLRSATNGQPAHRSLRVNPDQPGSCQTCVHGERKNHQSLRRQPNQQQIWEDPSCGAKRSSMNWTSQADQTIAF